MTDQPKPLSKDEQTEVLAILRNQDNILGLPIVQRLAATFRENMAMREAGIEEAARWMETTPRDEWAPATLRFALLRKAAGEGQENPPQDAIVSTETAPRSDEGGK